MLISYFGINKDATRRLFGNWRVSCGRCHEGNKGGSKCRCRSNFSLCSIGYSFNWSGEEETSIYLFVVCFFLLIILLTRFFILTMACLRQTYMIFLAKLKKPHFSPGPESSECQLFSLDDIPFNSLSFSSMVVTLNLVCLRYMHILAVCFF